MFDEDDDILRVGRRGQISANIAYLMLKGAGYAAIVVLGIWLFIAVIAAIGRTLPPESRETPDPVNRDRLGLMLTAEEVRQL